VRRLGPLLAAAAGIVLAVLRPFRVEVAGRSMEPTLRAGDWLVATRRGRRARGAVVVLADPRTGRALVKRIEAVPGDVTPEGELGPDRYLVVGDNPSESTDGREFGPVRGGAIEGVVRFRYAPRIGTIPEAQAGRGSWRQG